MILVIDNYDSFTYNLVQYLGELGQELKVFRNDELSVREIDILKKWCNDIENIIKAQSSRDIGPLSGRQ